MTKKVLRGSLLFFLCFAILDSLAQQKCPFKSISVKPFFAGYPDRDSNSIEITSEAAALLKRAAPGQKLFLDHTHIANDSGQIYFLQTEMK